MVSSVRWRSAFLAAAAFVVGFATDGAAQATGTIEGRVTEAGSGRPLAGAQVFVAGTSIGGVTNERGDYRITGAPARQLEVRVRLIGFSPINRTVVVTAGQTVTQNIEVGVSALQLEQVVVTGTGAQVEVRKLGKRAVGISCPASASRLARPMPRTPGVNHGRPFVAGSPVVLSGRVMRPRPRAGE